MKDVYLLDLINGISNALDYVSTAVTGHHRRVGIACATVAPTLGLSKTDAADLIMAALLHDIGAFSLNFSLDGLNFDADLTEHASMGFKLLEGHPLLNRSAYLVKYHHTPWRELLKNPDKVDKDILFFSNLLNLMDRVDVLSKIGTNIFSPHKLRQIISGYSDTIYSERAIAAFMEASSKQEFWDRIEDTETPIRELLGETFGDQSIPEEQLLHFSRFFSHIIDFRSRHTATHSLGVAEMAVELARLAGMDAADQRRIRLAGNLHDIGKLAVPVTLLDKPAPLTHKEFETVQYHAHVCEQVLHSIPGMEDIAVWACQHHERLNGKGYPHGRRGNELSLGSRILAVADVYTAITEDRPYRDGMIPQEAKEVLTTLAKSGDLDQDIIHLLFENYENLDIIRSLVQARALDDFKRFRSH